MNDTYLYRHALRGNRPLTSRLRWWWRFRAPELATKLVLSSLVMGVIACIYSGIDRI